MRILLFTVLCGLFSAVHADNPQLMTILKKKCKDEVKNTLCKDSGEGILLIHCLAAQTNVSPDCKASMDILLKTGDLPPEPPEEEKEKVMKAPEKPVDLGEIPSDPGLEERSPSAAPPAETPK